MFGDTVELQGEKLLSLIQNAVSYGEWELAQASSKLYYQTTTTNRNDLQVLLQGIIQHPRKYRYVKAALRFDCFSIEGDYKEAIA